MGYQEFKTKIKNIFTGAAAQPDAYTCQSTCIYEAIGRSRPITTIRAELVAQGSAGDPYNMGRLLKANFGDRYEFDDNACLSEVRDWLKAGEFLIIHGWFTGSGHVISLDGVAVDPKTLSYKINVKDPWGEFDFRSWSYLSSAQSYDGYYSSHGIYAACIAGQSVWDAREIYGELDSMRKGAWVHRIRP